MSWIDTCRLAIKGLHRGWAVVISLGIAMSTVCFLFAGIILLSINTEKAEPCELTAQVSDIALSDPSVVNIRQIQNVTAATGRIEVPVTLTSGKYTASLTLYGIDRNYLKAGFSFGGLFPETSVMPYIVLNSAAIKEFTDKNNPPASDQSDYVPAIDWASVGIALTFGDSTSSKPVTSKVCGILKKQGENEEPAGYISISEAKNLLRSQESLAEYTSIAVRIRNIGYAKDVAKKITALGYAAADPSLELQAKWERREMEMANLIMVGTIGLLCFSFLIAAVDRGNLLEQRKQLEMLRFIGMPISKLKIIYFLQTALIDMIGVLLGIAVGYLIPSFVPTEQVEMSVFALPVSFLVAIVVGIMNTGLFLLPSIYANKKLDELTL